MPRSSRIPSPRASLPLGSLTQASAAALGSCGACGSPRVTRIALSLTDGSPVELTSCHRCEHRTWQGAGGEVLEVATVLDRTRKRR
jgi:hypothetical protein